MDNELPQNVHSTFYKKVFGELNGTGLTFIDSDEFAFADGRIRLSGKKNVKWQQTFTLYFSHK